MTKRNTSARLQIFMHFSDPGGSLWKAGWKSRPKRKTTVAVDPGWEQAEMVGMLMNGASVEVVGSRVPGEVEI